MSGFAPDQAGAEVRVSPNFGPRRDGKHADAIILHYTGMETGAAAAEKVLGISLTLYRDGATNYLDVVTAQTAALEAERSVLSLKTRRVEADVALMVALGGGWSVKTPAVEVVNVCLAH